jgi:membrane protease YdiL (CAAX protease family)
VLSSIGTAWFDEFLFRGVILGLLLGLGLPDWAGVVLAAIVYMSAVRASSAGRGLLDTAIALMIGLASGLVVLLTAGIAAALVGHAITRFAFFLALGHPTRAPVHTALSAESQLFLVPPPAWPPGSDEDDGRGGFGPVRPA